MRMENPKLFAIYLGGRAPKCNTELHDVVFVVASAIESSYEQVIDKWFGDPLRVHLDSWLELEIVDGHRIALRPERAHGALKLFFVNLGAYVPDLFTELHANAFFVGEHAQAVKQRAKRELLRGSDFIHTDDLFEIDDCLELTEVDGYHVHLEPTTAVQPLAPHNGYHVIPPAVFAAYCAKRATP